MAYTPTGRPRGRPKTKDYETLVARVPGDLAEQVKRYAERHRQSVSELIRDGLEWRIEQDTPGRAWRGAQAHDADDFPMPNNGDTVLHELSPGLHAAITTAALAAAQAVMQAVPHALAGNAVIQEPLHVLQHETGESPPGAAALDREHSGPDDATQPPYDTTRSYLGKLCPKGHNFQGTGMSLLRRHNNGCRECENQAKREKRAARRQNAAREG